MNGPPKLRGQRVFPFHHQEPLRSGQQGMRLISETPERIWTSGSRNCEERVVGLRRRRSGMRESAVSRGPRIRLGVSVQFCPGSGRVVFPPLKTASAWEAQSLRPRKWPVSSSAARRKRAESERLPRLGLGSSPEVRLGAIAPYNVGSILSFFDRE